MPKRLAIITFFLLLFIFGLKAGQVQAATLFFSPSNKVNTGNIVEVGLYVNTADLSINNIEGSVVFPSDLLEVVSINKTGSIFSLWVGEPSFSNSSGLITFNGGLPNPGYKGFTGKVFNVIFRAKAKGEATLYYNNAVVRANDGLGTDILTGSGNVTLSISGETISPSDSETDKNKPETVPSGDISVSSITHPDWTKWYNNRNAAFSWVLDKNANAVRVSIDTNPQGTPKLSFSPPISERTFEDLPEGISYFHIQQKKNDNWGAVTHYKIQVDTTEPESLVVEQIVNQDETNPQVQFNIKATDKISGIKYYQIQYDNNPAQETWKDDGSAIYTTKTQRAGEHFIIVRAIDNANNIKTEFAQFKVAPLAAPEITNYPIDLKSTSPLVIKGTAKPGMEVILWLSHGNDVLQYHKVPVDNSGHFVYISTDNLDSGAYQIWAVAEDQRGAKSAPSPRISILVKAPLIDDIQKNVFNYIGLVISLITLFFAMLFFSNFVWHKYNNFRKRLFGQVRDTKANLHDNLMSLRHDIEKEINQLVKAGKKRILNDDEKMVIDKLNSTLDHIDNNIATELKSICSDDNWKNKTK